MVHQFQFVMFVSESENVMKRQAGLICGVFGQQADALIIRDLLFTSVYINELDIHVLTVFIHDRPAEVLLHSIYHDDGNAMCIDAAFT